MFNPFGELKKRLYTAVSIAFVLPLAIGAGTYFLVKTAPFVLLGVAIMGAGWLAYKLWRRWQD
jgi:hypothetical protein